MTYCWCCWKRLTPPERAAFVLREAFGHSHREVAEVLEVDEVHVGRELVLRYLLDMTGDAQRIRLTTEVVNEEPALVVHLGGRLVAVVVPEFDRERIVALRAISNPDKLTYCTKQTM